MNAKFKIWKYKNRWYLLDKKTCVVYNTFTWAMALLLIEDIKYGLPVDAWRLRPRTYYGNA